MSDKQPTFIDYPVLVIRMCLEIGSCLSYLTCLALILKYDLKRQRAMHIFLSICLIQFLLIFAPFVLTPLWLDGDPTQKTSLNDTFCQTQAVLMLLGWLAVTFLSVWMSDFLLRMVEGQKSNLRRFFIALTVLLCIFIVMVIIMFTIKPKGDLIAKATSFRWSFRNESYYLVCSSKSICYMIIEFIVQISAIVSLIYYGLKIKNYKQSFLEEGINWELTIVDLQQFGQLQVSFWSINLSAKLVEFLIQRNGNRMPDNIIFSILWQLCNLLYDSEGLFVMAVFLSQQRLYFEPDFPIVYKIIDFISKVLCCWLKKRIKGDRLYPESVEEEEKNSNTYTDTQNGKLNEKTSSLYTITILIVKLSMLVLSVLSFLLLIVLVFYEKLYQGYAAILILSLSSAQLILVFLPLMIYLLESKPFSEQGGSEYCSLQGYTMLVGWSICSFISIFMSLFTLRRLQGFAISKPFFMRLFGAFILWIITYALLVRYDSEGFKEFPWYFNGQPYYVFCSCPSAWFLTIYGILDGLQILLWVGLWKLIQREKAKYIEIGHEIDNILIDTQWFGFVQVVLWSVNSFFKLLDYSKTYTERNIFMEIIFFIANQIYDLNGFISLLMFLYLFRDQVTISKWFMQQIFVIKARNVTELYSESNESLIVEE